MDAQKFGAFVADCRKAENMTQAELAAKIQVTDKSVSRWERGIGFPDINTIEPLADALGVSILELMKSERLAADHVTGNEAETALSDTLEAAKLQCRLERRNTLRISITILVLAVFLLLFDNLNWQADAILFTCTGVLLPLFCIFASVLLLGNAVWRKLRGQPYRQTLTAALILLFLLLLFLSLFFFIGAAGIGPVPD